MLLARLVTVKTDSPGAHQQHSGGVSATAYERILKRLAALMGRK